MDSPAASMRRLREVLDDRPGAARDVVLLNAGFALYAADVAADVGAGIESARQALASGAARAKAEEFIRCTRRLGASPAATAEAR